MTEELHDVRLVVNGVPREARVPARRLLSDCLRHELRLTGTHVGCEHGVCGACTVLLDGEPVRSCLLLAVTADGTFRSRTRIYDEARAHARDLDLRTRELRKAEQREASNS